MRLPVAAALLSAVVVLAGAASAPGAGAQELSVFGGLGTWVDIYDGAVYAAPERTAQRISARGVRTVWVETANFRASADVVNRAALGRFVEALHARGVGAVAWYLPGHVNPALDVRRALAMLSFRTASGQPFDAVALDIESTKLRNVGLRSRRAVALAQRLKQEAGETPVAIVPFNPRGLERRPATWPRYVTRALRLLRAHTGNPDVPIHVAGGVADRLGTEELAGFVAAVEDDGGTIGVSLYDWATTPARAWPVLASATD